MHPAFDKRSGWQDDAFTVARFRGVFKGVWAMRACCGEGHPTPREAAEHAARINVDRALVAWARLETVTG